MSLDAVLALRREELSRRVAALPAEVTGWRARSQDDLDMNAHFSQLRAIEILTQALVARQQPLLDSLDAAGDAEAFRVTAARLVNEIILTQGIWDFFRDKLELRFSPDFKDSLWLADTAAWDCYRPVMDRAVEAGIVPAAEVREPPLTYLTAEFSPATWWRGSRPNDGRVYSLGEARLPVPVIEFPWDHMGNLWELVSLHHEVGHDVEADLHLRRPLEQSLESTLGGAGVPAERVSVWKAWVGEIFADLVGLQLGGPAFASGLFHLLLLPSESVTTYDPDDPHPTHYVRLLMNAAYMRTLVEDSAQVQADADELEGTWKSAYGQLVEFAPFVGDFPSVFKALMDTAFAVLKGKTVRELMPYTSAHDNLIRAAAEYLLTGQNAPAPLSTAPRHCLSAARVAATKAAAGDELDETLSKINERLIGLVRDSAPPGLRASDDSPAHEQFVAGFADVVGVIP